MAWGLPGSRNRGKKDTKPALRRVVLHQGVAKLGSGSLLSRSKDLLGNTAKFGFNEKV